jgi:alpha-D-ribose 1-methylphosphonate 5-triphosphate synthase subunit PhnG
MGRNDNDLVIVIAATTAIGTATAAISITAAATTATAVATAITTATAAIATRAGWAVFFGLGEVNLHRAAIQLATVQGVHGVLGTVIGGHLDKAKAFAATAHAIHHHFGALHFSGSLKKAAQPGIVCGIGQVAYIQSRSSHTSPDYWLTRRSRLVGLN